VAARLRTIGDEQAEEGEMRTEATEMFGIELPIFAFSHCRDVVLEATRAGGMGVLGAAWMTPDELEVALNWIDERCDGKPYAVDIVFPGTYEDVGAEDDPQERIPAGHREFVDRLMTDADIPPLLESDEAEFNREFGDRMKMTPSESERCLEIALRHPNVTFIVNAMGVPPRHVVDRIHAHGLKVGSLVGTVRHALKQRDLGVDVIIGQGSEAGGHVGTISSMVLWPQLVDAIHPVPVLAAGGIGRGRQFVAAMALGAAGIWCGSIWLGSRESDLNADMREALFKAKAEDAVVSKSMTGKACRILRSKYTDAWDNAAKVKPLTFPMQSILGGVPLRRAERAHRMDYWTYAVGQVVGDMNEETSVRSIFNDMLGEYVDSMEVLDQLLED